LTLRGGGGGSLTCFISTAIGVVGNDGRVDDSRIGAVAGGEVLPLKLGQRQIDGVQQLSADAVELRAQLACKIAHLLWCGRAGTPVGNQGFLHADREPDLQREQSSGRSGVDAESARLSDRRFEHLSLALGIDDRRIAGVLPGGHVLHQAQPILHRLKYGAHVCIRVGKCRSGAGRRRQQEQEEDG